MNNELNKGVDREKDVAIKDKLREHKGEEIVKVDKEIEVEDDGWKDGKLKYVFDIDYGYD